MKDKDDDRTDAIVYITIAAIVICFALTLIHRAIFD